MLKTNKMKKILLIIPMILLLGGISFGQTAVNFTVNDCNSTSTDLFTELNAGKVVVITWVMPCGACIGVASSVNTVVAGYASSNPGKVLYYLVDDYANTNCSTLSSWASTNSVSPDATFSNSAVKMSDYGSAGMQKTVVLGGTNHTVFYNVIGAINSSNMQTAINNALAATGINDIKKTDFRLKAFPNPVIDKLSVSYSLEQSHNVKVEVVNMLGEKIKEIKNEKQVIGQHELLIGTEDLSSGEYFLKVTSNDLSQLVKFTVAR